MNERIRELYEQAHEQKPVIVADPVTFEPIHKIGNYDSPMHQNVFNPGKFAELMVKDFLFQLADARLEFVWNSETDEVFKQTVAKIKAHYGVEK